MTAEASDQIAHVQPTADVDDRAVLGAGTMVWHLAQVREDARLGRDCIVGRGAYVGPGVIIGDRVKLQNYALVYEPTRLEDGVFIGPAAVLTNDQYPRSVDVAGALKRPGDWQASGVVVREAVGRRPRRDPSGLRDRTLGLDAPARGNPRRARLRTGGRPTGAARRVGRPGRGTPDRNTRWYLALPADRGAVCADGRRTTDRECHLTPAAPRQPYGPDRVAAGAA